MKINHNLCTAYKEQTDRRVYPSIRLLTIINNNFMTQRIGSHAACSSRRGNRWAHACLGFAALNITSGNGTA